MHDNEERPNITASRVVFQFMWKAIDVCLIFEVHEEYASLLIHAECPSSKSNTTVSREMSQEFEKLEQALWQRRDKDLSDIYMYMYNGFWEKLFTGVFGTSNVRQLLLADIETLLLMDGRGVALALDTTGDTKPEQLPTPNFWARVLRFQARVSRIV